MSKGLIALDIDGTIAPPGQAVSNEVLEYLQALIQDDWALVFITGRSFQFGHLILDLLKAPYYFIAQNGAITLEMPSKTIINKKYLDRTIISKMQEICEGDPSHFVIYGGIERNDHCYYQSNCFSSELRSYLKARKEKFKEIWHDIADFDSLEIDSFPSVKCFGTKSSAQKLSEQIENQLGLHVPLIRDPFDMNFYVAQATHPDSSKGQALKDLAAQLNPQIIIAAGDDYNDRTMLDVADIKIVMETAPADLKQIAHIIAPSAEQNGIIAGLNSAINLQKRSVHER